MKKLNKKGMISVEILALIFVPGALTAFIIYKIATKIPIISKYLPSKLTAKI